MDDDTRLDVALQAKAGTELRSTVRVYRKEFLLRGFFRSEMEARAFAETFAGRVRPGDVETRFDEFRLSRPWGVWVRAWNVAGEYKDEGRAEARVRSMEHQGFETRVVDRNSRQEHELRSYGVVRLPS
jgi:hypothetical protein